MENTMDLHSFNLNSNRNIRSNSTSKVKLRPKTPHIDLVSIRDLTKSDKDPNYIYKNFPVLLKQIIDNTNTNFLNGDINVIDYLISKYTNVPREEIKTLDKLSLKIDSGFGLLNQFGYHLPNLSVLKLNNSILNDFSEIGASFKNLKILHVSNCNINDLSGIVCFENLEELDCSFNKINDLFEFSMIMTKSLQRINLESNQISEKDNLYYLADIDSLKEINIEGNPFNFNLTDAELKEIFPKIENFKFKVAIYIDDDDLETSCSSLSRLSTSKNFGRSLKSSRPVTSSSVISEEIAENKDENKQFLLTSRETLQGASSLLGLRKYKDDFGLIKSHRVSPSFTASPFNNNIFNKTSNDKDKFKLNNDGDLSPLKDIKDLKLVRKKFELIQDNNNNSNTYNNIGNINSNSISIGKGIRNRSLIGGLLKNNKKTLDAPIKVSKLVNTIKINIDASEEKH